MKKARHASGAFFSNNFAESSEQLGNCVANIQIFFKILHFALN